MQAQRSIRTNRTPIGRWELQVALRRQTRDDIQCAATRDISEHACDG